MPLVPYRPFGDLERWLDRWFDEDWWVSRLPESLFEMPVLRVPRMNIYEEKDNIVAEVELPGVDPQNIDVQIQDNVLSVEAKREEEKEEKERGYYRRELARGYYRRSVPLPVEVVAEKAEASYEDGVLRIVVPKAKPKKEEKKSTKIKVKTKKV